MDSLWGIKVLGFLGNWGSPNICSLFNLLLGLLGTKKGGEKFLRKWRIKVGVMMSFSDPKLGEDIPTIGDTIGGTTAGEANSQKSDGPVEVAVIESKKQGVSKYFDATLTGPLRGV